MLPMTATYSTVSGPHWQESRNLSTALTHPNGNITVEVILFVNVSLSFGWTKSIKLRPCHISFGNPKTSVIEVVVCNTIPSLRLTAAQKPPIPVDSCSLSKTSVIWYLVASPAWPRNIYFILICFVIEIGTSKNVLTKTFTENWVGKPSFFVLILTTT